VNDQIQVTADQFNRFQARSVPEITIEKYLQRIAKYAPYPSECLLIMLIYIDRLVDGHPYFVINSYNVHRILLTSLICAIKYHCDQLYTNTFYAKVRPLILLSALFTLKCKSND
jgi:hypothetical protein